MAFQLKKQSIKMSWNGLIAGYSGVATKPPKKIFLICARCTKKFPVNAARAKSRVHCSRVCAAAASASKMKSVTIKKNKVKPNW